MSGTWTFPAVVQTPTWGGREVGVWVEDDVLRVLTAPDLVALQGTVVDVTEGDGRRPATEYLVLIDGEQVPVSVTAGGGCGCGSTLKRYDPRTLPITQGT